MATNMELAEIYNSLLAGNKLTLEFTSDAERQSFKAQLYRYKKREESSQKAVGLLEEEEKLPLHWSTVYNSDNRNYFETVWAAKPKAAKFKVISEEQVSDDGT